MELSKFGRADGNHKGARDELLEAVQQCLPGRAQLYDAINGKGAYLHNQRERSRLADSMADMSQRANEHIEQARQHGDAMYAAIAAAVRDGTSNAVARQEVDNPRIDNSGDRVASKKQILAEIKREHGDKVSDHVNGLFAHPDRWLDKDKKLRLKDCQESRGDYWHDKTFEVLNAAGALASRGLNLVGASASAKKSPQPSCPLAAGLYKAAGI